jgi:hypothetical protein
VVSEIPTKLKSVPPALTSSAKAANDEKKARLTTVKTIGTHFFIKHTSDIFVFIGKILIEKRFK